LVGCGLGGKLGYGSRTDEKYPRMIEQFKHLKLELVVIATGASEDKNKPFKAFQMELKFSTAM
jgi:hypothetical protein